jgi:ATP-dependent DNA helicase RecQ
LRAKRLELARSRGVPPYIIFNDRTLREMAVEKPTTLESLARIPGIGERKLHRYGEAFLDILRSA